MTLGSNSALAQYQQQPWAAPGAAPYPNGAALQQGNGYPGWQGRPGAQSGYSGTVPPPGAPGGQPFPVNPQLEQLIPQFGKPYPQVPPSMAAPMPPGPGFGSGWVPAAQSPAANPQEQRVSRLEQIAFGSTYPEHEVDDRIEHLEHEVFGSANSGDIETRLGKLEGKLGGGSAFGRTPPALVPVPASASAPAYQPPPATPSMPPPPTAVQFPPPGSQQPQALLPERAQAESYVPPGRKEPPVAHKAPPPAATKNPAKAKATATPTVATAIPATAPPRAMQNAAPSDDQQDRRQSEFETAIASIPHDDNTGDFFSAVESYPAGIYPHWSSFPVRFHLPMNTPGNWLNALESGVRLWSRVIPVMIAPPQEPADVEVAWINQLPPHEFGITNLEVFNGHMRMTVYLLRPNTYPAGTPDSILALAAAHEFGHALGIWGHSQNAGDIMSAVDTSKTHAGSLSGRDINTLRRLYQAPGLPFGFQSPQPMGLPFTHYAPLRK
jgi:predicted Zn-dependent protease